MRTKTIKATVGVNPGYSENNTKELNYNDFFTVLQYCCKMVKKDTGVDVSFIFQNGRACYDSEYGCPMGGEPVYTLETTMDPRVNTIATWEPAVMQVIAMLKEKLIQTNITVTGSYNEVTYLSDYTDRINNLAPDGNVYWAKVREDAIIPTRRLEDAGYDLYANFAEDYKIIYPNTTELVGTGIAVSVPVGYKLQIEERGSTGSKGIKYSAGVIDSGYRGEINLCVTNTNTKPVLIIKSKLLELIKGLECVGVFDAFIIYPYEKAIFQGCIIDTSNELDSFEIDYETLCSIKSERGTGKLGSSGK